MTTPVFFVIGPVGHGKTAAREILARLTRLKGGSSSDVIYAFLAFRRNVSQESLRQLPKESFRPELIEAGDFMVGVLPRMKDNDERTAEIDASIYRRPSALIRTLYMNGYNIIDGVRRRHELTEAIDHFDWNGIRTLIVHVSDPRKPIVADNSEDLKDLANEVVVNDGTLEELEAKLRALFPKHFGAPLEEFAPVPVLDFKSDDPIPEGVKVA